MKSDLNRLEKIKTVILVSSLTSVLIVMIAVLICISTIGLQRKDRLHPGAPDAVLRALTNGWQLTDENGNSEEVALPADITIPESGILRFSYDETLLTETDGVLFFRNPRLSIAVSEDGNERYSVNTSRMQSILRFLNSQTVALSHDAASLEITISGTPGQTVSVPAFYYGPFGAVYEKINRDDPLTAFLLAAMIMMAIAMLILMFYGRKFLREDSRPVSLLLFLILTGIWGFADSDYPVLTRLSQEFVGLLCYFSMLAMPVPISVFAWQTLKGHKIFPAIAIAGSLNMMVMGLLGVTGILELQYSFYTSFALFLFLSVAALFAFAAQRKRDRSNPEYHLLFIGSMVFASFGILGMVLYLSTNGRLNYRVPILTGILIFLYFLTATLITHYAQVLRRNNERLTEMKLLEHFSYTDILTGLSNRRSFEKELERIAALPKDADAVLIMFDLNGLKRTNDNLGHDAGDDLIASAARTIEAVFGSKGHCFRIGGDEFTVIITDPNVSVALLMEQLDGLIERHNRGNQLKLSIARGESHLIKNNGSRLTISDWKQEADVEMYKNKAANAIEQRPEDRARDLADIIDCIISTMEARDVYTASHSDRVRQISVCIARALGVSSSTRELIDISAHLHDIGKVGIPDSILLKPGRLTDEEFAVMKTHPVIGSRIAARAQGMAEVAKIILHHHERYDGRGYPTGIAGEDIPLGARIIAIADSIDAMTSKRCYRDALSIDACRAEIERCVGTMYDPAIARIALEHWSEIKSIILLHPKRLADGQLPNNGTVSE